VVVVIADPTGSEPNVEAGSNATLAVAVPTGTSCAIVVSYKSGPSSAAGSLRAARTRWPHLLDVDGRVAHDRGSLADRHRLRRFRLAAHVLRGYVSGSLHADDARRVSGFRFRLYSDDWDELGEFETIVPNWSVGDEFTSGDGRRFRIVGIVGVPDDVGIYNSLWKVEPVPD
jgi:hypothetical protein